MKLKITRSRILIEPETEEDIAFIEDTLKLTEEGDSLKLMRENGLASKSLLWLSTSPTQMEEEGNEVNE